MGRLTAALRRIGRLGREAPDGLSEQVIRTLELVVDPDQLRSAIMGFLIDFYGARRAALLLWHDESEQLQAVWLRGHAETEEIGFAGDGRLARWLAVNGTPLRPPRQPEVIEYLGSPEGERLKTLQTDLCLPLLAMNRLIGVVLLGNLAHPLDRELPPHLLAQIGLALQNSRLHAQQQLRLRRLSRAERLASVGELAASAAHEIRNPLTAISSAVQLLGEALPPGNPRREIADGVMREIDRINQIVEGLLSFARPSQPRRETVHLQPVVEEAVQLVRTMAAKARVAIETELDEVRDEVQGDRDQLVQVILNLLMNAIQAMPAGGTVRVQMTRSRRCRITVADTGVGMSPEQLERAFDPFYTTKDRGTGLGLPICYGIVRGHGGEIDLESRPGQGTTVCVEL
jgi:signal transduction histidine kinase